MYPLPLAPLVLALLSTLAVAHPAGTGPPSSRPPPNPSMPSFVPNPNRVDLPAPAQGFPNVPGHPPPPRPLNHGTSTRPVPQTKGTGTNYPPGIHPPPKPPPVFDPPPNQPPNGTDSNINPDTDAEIAAEWDQTAAENQAQASRVAGYRNPAKPSFPAIPSFTAKPPASKPILTGGNNLPRNNTNNNPKPPHNHKRQLEDIALIVDPETGAARV